MLVKSKETPVDVHGFFFHYTRDHFDARRLQLRDTLTINRIKGIGSANHQHRYFMIDDELAAGRRFAVMCAGLQGNIQGTLRHQMAVGFAHAVDAIYLCMRCAILFVAAFADDPAFMHQHRAHHRVGCCMPRTLLRQLQASLHICLMIRQAAKVSIEK